MPARSADQHLLMIAAQADETTLLIRLPTDKEIHDLTAVGAPVDIIADKNEPSALFPARKIAYCKQREQFVEASVNIANGERK